MVDEQKEFEELVSIVDKVLHYGAKCPNCKYCEFCGGALSMPCTVCKIVTELQNANYRKGEIISHQAMFDAQAAERIAQLERALEIAESTKSRLTIFDRLKIHETAEKETAKKILDEVSKHYGGAWLVELCKKYDVEVE
jgi:hypothetical protein